MEEMTTKRKFGGAQVGAGRSKLTGDAVTKQVQFRLTAEQELVAKRFIKLLKSGELPNVILDYLKGE